MFYYLEGVIAETEPYMAVIDCAGVGYACHTTSTTLSSIRKRERARLYTYTYIREDIFDIYGFATKDELSCFKQLIGISGVGPKAAISILSANPPERLAMCIITGDDKALTCAPGIGKKLAQRIILELKDKIAKEQLPLTGGFAAGPASGGNKTTDAVAALSVLGYGQSEIAQALKNMDVENCSLEEIVRGALKRMLPKE